MAFVDDPETQAANSRFIRRTMKQPLLSRELEFELATRWREKGDEKALHRLINAYARLAVSIAGRFRNYGLPFGDLVQEGMVGLMQAAERFEPEREVRFSTYASWWIRAAIQDFILRNWSIVRLGTTSAQKSLFFNLRRLRARIDGASATSLSQEARDKIAEELNVKESDVETMEMRLNGGDQSLNAMVGEDTDDQWQDLLPDDRPSPETVAIGLKDAETRSRWLEAALGALSDREQKIIRERRLSDEGATLEQLGQALGVSKERVRQLEQRALGKMRQHIADSIRYQDDLFSD
jgi:RNA polymerase sigma-32 factor